MAVKQDISDSSLVKQYESRLLLLHNQWPGNPIKFFDRDGPETAYKGNNFHLAVECICIVIQANGDVTEIFITPFLLHDGMPVTQPVGNQIKVMKAYMPVPEGDLFHIELLSIQVDHLAFHKFPFPHDSFGALLTLADNDGCRYDNSREQ